MPTWPGGSCPDCGQDMPANLIHCQFCRALLNSDLHRSDVEVPQFFELKEIGTVIDVEVAGYFILCPHCREELRINRKYAGVGVACKHCNGQFLLDLASPRVNTKAFYASCGHCDEELRVAPKYLGMNVACKFCEGHVRIQTNPQRVR
ncbi:MAG: zinc ribbon domain-containing protein [Planctomycetota bacterium]|nr:zinc ribbon domain-containing protein [Planctomycetota bacterium]